jgi:hypothetical protein
MVDHRASLGAHAPALHRRSLTPGRCCYAALRRLSGTYVYAGSLRSARGCNICRPSETWVNPGSCKVVRRLERREVVVVGEQRRGCQCRQSRPCAAAEIGCERRMREQSSQTSGSTWAASIGKSRAGGERERPRGLRASANRAPPSLEIDCERQQSRAPPCGGGASRGVLSSASDDDVGGSLRAMREQSPKNGCGPLQV